MNNWLESSEFNELWVINHDPADPWYCYFDSLCQFEMTRNRHSFLNKARPWLFSARKYLPASLIFIAHPSAESRESQLALWRSLGEPRTLVFSSGIKTFLSEVTIAHPEKFKTVEALP